MIKKIVKQRNKNIITHKNKLINNINNNSIKFNLKKNIVVGGSFLDKFSGLIQIPKKKNYTVGNPFKFLNPRKLTKFANSMNIFRIYFNYKMPGQTQLKDKLLKSSTLSNNIVAREPYIIISNAFRYLISLVEINTTETAKNKLLWLVEFKNNSKVKTFLSYIPPSTNVANNYKIQIFNYPDLSPEYQPAKTSNVNRNLEYINFQKFLQTNPTKIKLAKTFNFLINNKLQFYTKKELLLTYAGNAKSII